MPDPVQHIDIELEGVGHLLKDKSLRVPQYQRSYAWEDRQVIDFLKDIERFKTAFASATVSKAPIARYYLRTLDRQIRGDDQPELVVNENEEEVNLEHVLPETITPGWNVTQPVADANFRRIGNLTLLREAENVDIGNGTPLEKLPLYLASSLRITTDVATRIGQSRDWTPVEIATRQQYLAEQAVIAWSLRLG